MTKECAISVIQTYANTYLFAPRANWGKSEFERRSYSRWAAAEIIDKLRSDQTKDPVDIVRHFVDLFDRFSETKGNPNAWVLFRIAWECAKDILSMIS